MFVGLFAEVRAADSSDPQQCAERSLPGARQSTGESIYPSQFRYCTGQTRCFQQEALQKQNCVHLSTLSYLAGVKHAFPVLTNICKDPLPSLAAKKQHLRRILCAHYRRSGLYFISDRIRFEPRGFASMHRKETGMLPPNDAMQDAVRVVETSTGDFSPLETSAVKNTAAVSWL